MKARREKETQLAPLATSGACPGWVCGETVSVATAAKLLGVSRRAVQYMLEDGRLEGTRLRPRGWWRVRRDSLARLSARPNAGT